MAEECKCLAVLVELKELAHLRAVVTHRAVLDLEVLVWLGKSGWAEALLLHATLRGNDAVVHRALAFDIQNVRLALLEDKCQLVATREHQIATLERHSLAIQLQRSSRGVVRALKFCDELAGSIVNVLLVLWRSLDSRSGLEGEGGAGAEAGFGSGAGARVDAGTSCETGAADADAAKAARRLARNAVYCMVETFVTRMEPRVVYIYTTCITDSSPRSDSLPYTCGTSTCMMCKI